METEGFRKLEMELPRQKVVNPRPWAKAGWVLLLFVVCLILFFFLQKRA